MAMLKARRILHLRPGSTPSSDVTFARQDDDTARCSVVLSEADWEDFGEPREITVTIEPGDKLNERTL